MNNIRLQSQCSGYVYGLDRGIVFRSPARETVPPLLVFKSSTPAWGPPSPPPRSKCTGISFREVMQKGLQADPSSPPSAKVKKAPSYTCTVCIGTNLSYFNDWIQRRRHGVNFIPMSANESRRWFVICKLTALLQRLENKLNISSAEQHRN